MKNYIVGSIFQEDWSSTLHHMELYLHPNILPLLFTFIFYILFLLFSNIWPCKPDIFVGAEQKHTNVYFWWRPVILKRALHNFCLVLVSTIPANKQLSNGLLLNFKMLWFLKLHGKKHWRKKSTEKKKIAINYQEECEAAL